MKWVVKPILVLLKSDVSLNESTACDAEGRCALDVAVRASWAYSDLMPIETAFGLRVGLSPLLQWILVHTVAFIITKRLSGRYSPKGA